MEKIEKMESIKVSLYGGSHEKAVGVRMIGVPKGTSIDTAAIDSLLNRRRAKKAVWSTPRLEADEYTFLCGVRDGVATGEEIVAEIKNSNTKSGDYPKYIPRPSHADYAAYIKDGAREIAPGGGRFSGRLTAPLCIAGGIAKGILAEKGIRVLAYVKEIGGVAGKGYADGVTAEEIILAQDTPPYSVTDGEAMLKAAEAARLAGDSVGGAVECIVSGMPVGIGDFYTAGIESAIAYELFGVPAVKAVEFGLGTGFSKAFGSEVNDPFRFEGGKVITATNNSGGVNGGISNGMPITFRATLRPTPSISKPELSVDLSTGENVVLNLRGRHDACIVPRAAAAIEAAAAIAVWKLISEEA